MSYGRTTKTGAAVLTSAFAATLVVHSANAGLKYWTTGRYDADSYVQDGLVLNYDGFRNVGIDQPHSTAANTVWKNLGSGGAKYDLTLSVANKGAWGDDGFDFKRATTYACKTDLTIGPQYTVQALLDAKTTDQPDSDMGYVFFPNGTENSSNNRWQQFSVVVRGKNKSNCTRLNSSIYFSNIDLSGTDVSYLTALSDGTYVSFFTGTAISNKKNLQSDKELATITPSIWAIGGCPGETASASSQGLVGTIKSYRHYNRALDENELVWNRAVDQTRYFGATPLTDIPVTNAVIASSIAVVQGNEKSGAYAVDASGYEFTAPATRVVEGREYTCAGHTLETWDSTETDWGAPVSHDGDLSATVAAGDLVRITWQWMPGDGIVTRYTTADYVQDGLILHYDGIRNVGVDQPHSYDTTQWKNLAPNGGYDTTLTAIASPTDVGHWESDGYRLEGDSSFQYESSFTVPSNQTQQVALLANHLEQPSGERYIFHADNNKYNISGSLSLRYDNNNTWFDYATHANGNRVSPILSAKGAPISYITAVRGDDFTAAFMGTAKPTANTARWATDAARMALTSVPQDTVFPKFGIGGTAGNGMRLVGTIHNYRLYNRVLEDSEIAANRVIDDYRFHGVMPVTNVVVATSHSFLSGSEKNGNYEISGRYTFGASAETRTDSRGFSYAFKGYTLEEWDASTQGWGDPVLHEGANAYEYVVGTAAAKVRLTWVWEASGNLRTAADYGLEDYVASGLVLHYDGIKNVGVESLDVTNAYPNANFKPAASKAWVNLANPGQFTLARADKTTAAGAWTTDGFAFTNESASVGSYFKYTGALTLTPSYTWQFLLDAKVADQPNETCGYIMFNDPWKASSLAVRTNKDYKFGLYYVPDAAFPGESTDYRPKILDTETAESKYTWATAILKGRNAMLFAGTEYPTDSVGKKTAPNAATAQTLKAIGIGGCNAGNGWQDFTGKIKNVRYYDRVLTEAELVRNREVDSARYFGVLATTNVFVVAGGEGAVQTESGAYKVEGEWTFTATKTLNKKGQVADVTRYAVSKFEGGEWKKQTYSGNSYTYTEGTSPATVRLEWLPDPMGMVIILK